MLSEYGERMSDFLNNLAAKSLGLADPVQPRIRSLFEPHSANARMPARLSIRSSIETDAVREQQSSPNSEIGATNQAASNLRQPIPDLIESSARLSADAPLKQKSESDTPPSDRGQPAHADATIITNSPMPRAAIDSAQSLAHDRKAATETASDASLPATKRADARLQIADERKPPVALEPDIRRIVEDQISRRKDNARPFTPSAESLAEKRAVTASPSRTIAPAQAPPTTRLPVAQQPIPVAPPRPEIKITIGRVDVRAVMPAQPVARARPAASSAPMALDDYLRERSGGRR